MLMLLAAVENPSDRGTLLHSWRECRLVQPLWKTAWSFLKKLKIELPYDPAIALLGIYPKDTDVVIRRGTCTQMFTAAMSTIAKLWKEPRCPSTDEWIKKMWFICTMEYYAATRRNDTLPFAMTWMELEHIILSKMSVRERQIPYDFIHMWNSRNKTWTEGKGRKNKIR